jgi:hypothetical protein
MATEQAKDGLDRCYNKGASHKAYGWSPQQTYNTDDRGQATTLYSEDQWRAYLEGYYGHSAINPDLARAEPALSGDALKAKIDEHIATLIKGWEDEKAARKASGRPDSDFAPGGFGP